MEIFPQVEVGWDDLAEQYDPTPDPHLDDPQGWVEERLDEWVWSRQQAIMESVVENRYTAVPSSFDTGKSFIASRLVAWWIAAHKQGEAFAVTTAPTWNQVQAILWREIRKAHKKGLPGRTTLDARWYIGGARIGDPNEELVALGRKPADYDPAAFQGIHAKYVLVVIDEGAGVPKLLYDAVDGLAANQYARVLAIGNPDDPASHFAEICRPGSGWNVIHISAFDTPAFTGEELPPGREGLLDLLVSPGWVEERRKRWGETSPMYVSKVLGQFPDIGEDTLIEPRLIKEAEQRDLTHTIKRQRGTYGWDVARYGSDKTVCYRNRAGVIRKAYEGEKQSTMQTAGHIMKFSQPHGGGARTVIDTIGVGAGVYDRVSEQRLKNLVSFQGSEKAHEPDKFINRRAEAFWHFRELMENGEIDLPEPGEDDDLKAQLGSIKWKVDSSGRVQIESKEDMKKRGLPSPNHADACVYSTVRGIVLPKRDEGEVPNTVTGDLMTKEM